MRQKEYLWGKELNAIWPKKACIWKANPGILRD